MKNLTFILAMVCTSLYGQNNDSIFKYESLLMSDQIVRHVPKMSQLTLYSKTLEWVGKTYLKPDNVVIAKQDSSMLRIEGTSVSLCLIKSYGMDVRMMAKYILQFDFKAERFRVSIMSSQIGGSDGVSFMPTLNYLKAAGAIQNGHSVKDKYQAILDSQIELYNGLVESLQSSFKDKPKTDNW